MSTVQGFRLSPQQARLCKQDLAPVEIRWQTDEALDAAELAARLAELAREEEVLRTRLVTLPGLDDPVQVIEDDAAICVYAQGERLLGTEAPVLTLHLETAGSGSQLRLQAAPTHFDRSSLRLLADWLLAGENNPARLQYADYAEWKWQIAEDEDGAEGRRYWREMQDRTQAFRGLLLERAAQGESAASGCRPLAPLPDALPASADRYGLTPETLLLAAWGALLSRLSGQNEVAVAWIDEGRGEGLEQALGRYEQVLPLALSFDYGRSLAVQGGGIATAVGRMKNWRDHFVGHTECAYAFDYAHLDLPAGVHELDSSDGHQPYALRLELRQGVGRLCARLLFDKTRFEQTAVDCLAEQWALLLDALVRTPDAALGALPLHGPLQQALLLPTIDAPRIENASVVDLITREAQRRPAAPAVSDSAGSLSYGELDTLSAGMAAQLQQSGVGAGVVVAILLPRRREALIAMLAVLKAGGAYLPVDPAYPAERRAYLLADSGARHLIHDGSVQDLPPVEHSQALDALFAGAATRAFTPVPLASDSPAYLIYTSGSTGQPKAVVISHGALSHSTQVRIAYYQESVRAYLLLSSFSFDSSVAGIYWTLCQGGRLLLPAPGDELAIDRLGRLIENEGISHGLSLPSLYQALLDEIPASRLQSLRAWIVAGEACPESLPRQHADALPQAGLFNEYGPTEATVWATVERLQPGRPVGIGHAIPTMQLDLINEQGLPAGIGELGEIVLSGPSLALGYWKREEATAAAFAALDAAGRARAYRTGDLAYRDAEGRLMFVGRKDHQVKIRGYRIELGEIERCLRTHADVREAAVVVQERGAGKRLLAYILARHSYAPASEAMLDYLKRYLPAHMLPAAVMTLDSFPRTPNGKLDTQALPDPDTLRRKPPVAPRNPTEAALAGIIAAVLRLPEVGVDDSFLEIGGDSILSLQVVARARELGLIISTRQIFDLQTVARLAEATASAATVPEATTLAPALELDEDELAALADELADLEPNA